MTMTLSQETLVKLVTEIGDLRTENARLTEHIHTVERSNDVLKRENATLRRQIVEVAKRLDEHIAELDRLEGAAKFAVKGGW